MISGLPKEGTHGWRMWPPAHSRQEDAAGIFGINKRPDNNVRIGHRRLRKKAEAKAGLDHALDHVGGRQDRAGLRHELAVGRNPNWVEAIALP